MLETEGFVLACRHSVINTLTYPSITAQQDVDTTCKLIVRQNAHEHVIGIINICLAELQK